MRYCSLPDVGNLRKWFEKNFSSPCEYHDTLYTPPITFSRWQADVMLALYMREAVENKTTMSKLFVYYPTIGITFVAVRLFGWVRYGRST